MPGQTGRRPRGWPRRSKRPDSTSGATRSSKVVRPSPSPSSCPSKAVRRSWSAGHTAQSSRTGYSTKPGEVETCTSSCPLHSTASSRPSAFANTTPSTCRAGEARRMRRRSRRLRAAFRRSAGARLHRVLQCRPCAPASRGVACSPLPPASRVPRPWASQSVASDRFAAARRARPASPSSRSRTSAVARTRAIFFRWPFRGTARNARAQRRPAGHGRGLMPTVPCQQG